MSKKPHFEPELGIPDTVLTVRLLIRFDVDQYIARSVDFDIATHGSTPEAASESLMAKFVAIYEAYSQVGRDMYKDHPKAPPELLEIFEKNRMFSDMGPEVSFDNRRFAAERRPFLGRQLVPC